MLHLQQVAGTAPLPTHLKEGGHVVQPGFHELDEQNVEAFVRNSFSSEYHPIGTCAMGPREEGSVVSERMAVHGTRRLRVLDASVFPLQGMRGLKRTLVVLGVAKRGRRRRSGRIIGGWLMFGEGGGGGSDGEVGWSWETGIGWELRDRIFLNELSRSLVAKTGVIDWRCGSGNGHFQGK